MVIANRIELRTGNPGYTIKTTRRQPITMKKE